MNSTAFLIDGTAFCYRAFYAIRSLSTADGRPTNAVYGVAMMVQALRQKEQPQYLAVAFDVGKPTFRHQKFEQYKVQRKPMPDALIAQIPVIKQLLTAWRIPVFEQEGFEAEDVLASLARRLVKESIEVYLVTGDKDALQLVNSHIKVYNPHKDGAVMDAAAVKERYGVAPEQMVDLLALMGDDIDNIPGVRGIGEKTATELLQQFGSLERLYERLDEVAPPSRRASLAAAREQVALSQELARIDPQVSLDVTIDALKIQEPDWRALRSLFRELEFKRLLQALEAHAPAGNRTGTSPTVHTIQDAEALVALCDRLQRCGTHPTAIAGWQPDGAEPAVLIGLATTSTEAWMIHWSNTLAATPAGARWRQWCEDPHTPKIGHDVKATVRLLQPLGVALHGVAGDTMLAAYLVNPARTSQPLSDLADELLGASLPSLPSGEALCTILTMEPVLREKLQAAELTALYRDLELPLLSVLARMEAVGVALDVPYLEGLKASMQAQLEGLTKEIFRLAGGEFNLNSPKQLAQVLFERLQLPVIKRTKTGASTDSDVLQQLATRHRLPQQLMAYRELSKLVSTYVDALPKLADSRTGRVHPTFNQAATATGRLSCSDPNLQNIPIKTELGRSIRKAFIPGIPDGVLVAADYSQIELRILAHVSGDEQLREAFRKERDIHRFTASLIYGIPEAEVQPEQRQAMKAVNFGILYGMSAHGLSKELGLSFEEAQAFIDAYFQRYPKVRQYLDEQIARARRDGFVQTLLGRRRYIPEVKHPDAVMRQFGERMAINAPIQGSAADLIKRAMVQLDAALPSQQLASRMLLQVHDELVFESPRAEVLRLTRLVRQIMEGAIALEVPLVVTIKAGANWLDLSPVEHA